MHPRGMGGLFILVLATCAKPAGGVTADTGSGDNWMYLPMAEFTHLRLSLSERLVGPFWWSNMALAPRPEYAGGVWKGEGRARDGLCGYGEARAGLTECDAREGQVLEVLPLLLTSWCRNSDADTRQDFAGTSGIGTRHYLHEDYVRWSLSDYD